MVALGFHCCAQASSSCGEQGLLFDAVHRLLRAGASLVKHGLEAHGLQELQHMGSTVTNRGLPSTGSVAVAHGLRCPEACGIFPD